MIVFAVVVFNRDVSTLPTLLTLRDSIRQVSDLEHHILLLDNSEAPNTASIPSTPNCTYVPFRTNIGISKAYNHALRFCVEHRAAVLVTLDQDSTVTVSYLEALRASARDLQGSMVAICPKVSFGNRPLSPWKLNAFGLPEFWPQKGQIYAINSFSAYSVEFLKLIGGFDEYYWLDALDFSTYARIHSAGKQVKLLDTVVEHDLSLLSGSISRTRFFNITYYEASFLTEYCRGLHIASGLLRLVLRSHRVAGRGLRGQYLITAMGACIKGALAGMRRRGRRIDCYTT